MLDDIQRERYLPEPFGQVHLEVGVHSYVRVEYLGPFDALVAAGTIDPHMQMIIARWRDGSKRPQGKRQTDGNGDSFHVYRKPTKRQPTRDRLVRAIHCPERALALPGVRELFPEGIELQPLGLKQPEPVPLESEDAEEFEDVEGWKHLSLPDRIARFLEKADPEIAMSVLSGGFHYAVHESGMKLRTDDEQRLNDLITVFENDFRAILRQSKFVPVERPSLSLVVDNTYACNVSGSLSR